MSYLLQISLKIKPLNTMMIPGYPLAMRLIRTSEKHQQTETKYGIVENAEMVLMETGRMLARIHTVIINVATKPRIAGRKRNR